jgi:pimeloyl-ACP methyl ester carboxylesterase
VQKVFLISGLGADRRLFTKLDLPGYELIYIDWLEPDRHDTLNTYAKQLVAHYGITPGSNVVGVSLGGMLTVEISSMVALHKAILVSSVQSAGQFPWYYSLFRRIPVYKILPLQLSYLISPFVRRLFGLRSQAERDIFMAMIRNISPKFMKWAMHALLHWQPSVPLKPVYHIHGNNDVVFSSKRITHPTHIIPGGSHNMVFSRAAEVSAVIQFILNNETA